MRSHLNQYVFFPLFWVMSLLIVTLFLLVVLLVTPFGPKLIAYVADGSVPGLNITGIRGSIFSGLRIDEFSWESEVGIYVKDINLNVNKYDIENKKIFADKLNVGELAVVLGEKKDEINIPNFGLPINIDAKELKLDSLQITRKIPDTDDTQTLLFQAQGLVLNGASIKDGQLNFSSLEGQPKIVNQPLKVRVTNGSLNMNKPHEMSTSGDISFTHPSLGDLQGQIKVGGSLTDYIVDADLVFEQDKIGSGSLTLQGDGSLKNVDLNDINIKSEHGNIISQGKVNWDPEIRFNFDIKGNQLATKELIPDWPITADAHVKYEGSFLDKRLENNVEIVQLEGLYNNQQLTGKGIITTRERLIRTENLILQLGDNVIKATGAVTEPLNLTLDIDAKKLSQILPDYAGDIKGEAVIKGNYKTPVVESELTANNFTYGDFEQGEETFFLNTNIELEEDETLTVKKLVAKIGNNEAKLTGKATEPFDLKWSIDADDLDQVSPLIKGQIQGEGVLKGTQNKLASTLNLQAEKLVYKDLQQGTDPLFLEGEVKIIDKVIQLKSLFAKSGINSINVTGQVSEPLDLQIEIDAKKLAEVSPDISGRVTGTASIQGPYKSPNIKADLTGSKLAFKENALTQADVKLKGELEILDGFPVVKQMDTQIGDNFIQVTGKATEPFDLKWTLQGKNLSQISPIVKGSIDGGGVITGTQKKLKTTLKLKADNLAVNDFKQNKDSLFLDGEISLNDKVIFLNALQAKSGINSINVNGQASEPLDLQIEIDAKKLVEVSPDISGRVTGTTSIQGLYKSPNIKTDLKGSKLAFKQKPLTQADVKLQGEIEIRDGFPIVKKMDTQIGDNFIQVSGKATEPFDLKWTIKGKNLSQISPIIKGNIDGNGVLTGTQKKLKTTLKLKADNLAFNEFTQNEDSLFLDGEIALDNKIIVLNALQAKSGTNDIKIKGRVSEPLELNAQVNAQNLTEVSPELSGRVTGTTTIVGSYTSPLIKTNLLGSELALNNKRFTQADVKLQGEVELRDGVPFVRQLNTQIGNNIFKVSGKASSPYDLKWDIEGKNLKQIKSEFSGNLNAKGVLQGTVDNPIINANGSAKNLKFEQFQLNSGNFTASTKDGVYRIKGDLKDIKNADQKVKSAKVELNGTIENHTVTAQVNHSEAKVNLKASGAWKNQRWNGSVNTLKLGDTQAGDWSLQKPTRVSFSKDGFKADKLCFSGGKTRACSTASYSKTRGLTAKGTLQKTPLSLLKPFLPKDLDLNGDVRGTYDIKQNNGKPSGVIKLTLPKSSCSFVDSDGVLQSLSYEDTELHIKINDRTIRAETQMKIINRGVFSSKVEVKLSPKNGKHTINGSADLAVPNINFAQQYIPRSRGLRGAMNTKLTFSGLLSKPQIKGVAEIKNAYLRLPEAGTEITNINLNVRADRSGQAQINGKMLMGKGVLNVSGDMDLKDISKWRAKVKISGENIRFMNTNEITAFASPNINLDLTKKVVNVTGRIDIPQANIRLKNIPETSIDESTDTFIIGETKAGEDTTAVKIRPRVLISLGKKVRMDAFGLEAKLSGDVNITHNRRDILANGSLRVQDGKYQAYGQDLAIDNGRLLFNGSPRLVGMDVRATRTIDKQIVGIHLGGTLLSPKSTLYAEPTLEEDSEILSYLITGNSLSSASGQESALLLSAVRGLGITGNKSIVSQIGSAFGLDDVNIVTKDDLKKSEIALGKRLGSRLYVRYLIGLFDQTQKIAIEYKINDVLSLEAQTTAYDFGLDFIYEIETN